MKPINIFTLSRIRSTKVMDRAERQMSKRAGFLKIRQWEVEGLKKLSDRVYAITKDISVLEFYYSFQISKLGKEFDLLRVNAETVINIELKSKPVSDDKIKKQLELNREYLALLGKAMRTYTYISSEDRLVRLTNSGRLVESTFEELCEDLKKQQDVYDDHLEKLFVEESYLISPLTDPDKFLRREYFLTAQQRDIKSKILKNISEKGYCLQGFTGLPGTGKTLLLYDLAMDLSEKDRVCVLHFGSFPEEMAMLNERLKRIDFVDCKKMSAFPNMEDYKVFFVDEGHRMEPEQLKKLTRIAKKKEIPMVFSYDKESSLALSERSLSRVEDIESIRGFVEYTLTNRIRMNAELSSFIGFIMKPDMQKRKKEYPNIYVSYAGSRKETGIYLEDYKNKGFIYIRGAERDADPLNTGNEIDASLATCREFDKVVMVIDRSFVYNDEGYLVSKLQKERRGESPVRMLFHGLSRARSQIALVIERNTPLFEAVLAALQEVPQR